MGPDRACWVCFGDNNSVFSNFFATVFSNYTSPLDLVLVSKIVTFSCLHKEVVVLETVLRRPWFVGIETILKIIGKNVVVL